MALRFRGLDDAAARRLLTGWFDPAPDVPIDQHWGPRGLRVRVTLSDGWQRCIRRVDLSWEAGWRLAVEPSSLFTSLGAWTAPGNHDVGALWSRRADAPVLTDVDGTSAWPLNDEQGQGARIGSALGEMCDLRTNGEGALTSIASAEARLDLTDTGVVMTTRDGTSTLARLHRDDAGQIRAIERPHRALVELEYDAERLTSVRRADGPTLMVRYLAERAASLQLSTLGAWTIVEVTPRDTVFLEVQRGRAWRYRRDDTGRLLEEQSPEGLTVVERDPETGAPVEIVRGDRRRHLYYDHDGYVVLVDTDGASIALRYDPAGRLVQAEEGDRTLLRRAYDPTGRLTHDGEMELAWDEHGRCTTMVVDAIERRLGSSGTEITSCTTNTSQWLARRGPTGSIEELTGPEGETLAFRFQSGRVVEWSSSDGFSRSLVWHPRGRWLGLRDASDELTLTRDVDGVLVCPRPGDPSCERLDEMGRVVERSGGGRPTLSIAYGPSGITECRAVARARVRTDGPVQTTAFAFRTETQTVAFAYDSTGSLVRACDGTTETVIERRNRRSIGERTGGDETRIARDDAGRRVSFANRQGLSIEYVRDASHRVARAIVRTAEASIDVEIGYDKNGREVRRAVAGVELQLMRDSLGRMVRRRVVHRGRLVESTDFTYQGARLVSIDGPIRYRFAYRNGALARVIEDDRTIYEQDGPDPIAPRCRYDEACRPISIGDTSVTHDAAGRRTEVQSIARYSYDAFDRVVRIDAAEPIVLRYDALGRWRDEAHGWDGARLVSRRRDHDVYADGVIVALLRGEDSFLVLPDVLGGVGGLVSIDGTIVWSQRPEKLLLGTRDDAIERYLVPALPGHWYDARSKLWLSIRGAFDPDTARSLVPDRTKIAQRHVLSSDPFSRDDRFHEQRVEGFDATWSRFLARSLCSDEDRPWTSLIEHVAIDPERVLFSPS